MKAVLFILSLALAFLSKSAAAIFVGEPVGFVTVSLAAPANGVPTLKLVGTPFHRASVFQGPNTLASPNRLQSIGSGWVAGGFTNTPHIARLTSGVYTGRSFAVVSNTIDTISLAANGLMFGVGDNFEVFPAHTLASLFGGGVPAPGIQTDASEAAADLVRLNTGSLWASYYHNGIQWRTPTDASSQNNTVIPPGQGMMVVRKNAPSLSVTLLGTVSTSPESHPIAGAGQAVLSPRFPLPSTLASLGVHSCAGWRAGRSASLADTLLFWNGSDWNVFYHTGSIWKKAGSALTQNDALIPAGEAVLVRRMEGMSGPTDMATSLPSFSYSTP